MKQYIKPFIPKILAIVILVFLSIVSELFLPRLMSRIVDQGVITGELPIIYNLGGKMVILAILSSFFMIVASNLIAKTSMGFSRDLRKAIFNKVLDLNFEQFEYFGAPSILTRSTEDVNQMERMAVVALRPLIRAPLMFIGALIMALTTDLKLSIVILISAPLLLFIVTTIARKSVPWFVKIRKTMDKINQLFRERLSGIRVIRAFNREEDEAQRFTKVNKIMRNNMIHVNNYMVTLLPTFNLIFNLSLIAILWFGAKRIDMGAMEVGQLMAFIQYIGMIMFSVMMFSMIFAMLPNAQASYYRIMEVLDTKEYKDSGLKELPEGTPTLEFDHVSFSYPHAEQPVLEDINFTVKGGEKLAIIGGTGSGKSTILKLINRFFDVTKGEIRLNGIPINELSLETLRNSLGYVPQQALLFQRSIKGNVEFGLEEELSDERTWEVLSVAQATNFIAEMNKQLEGHVAQSGRNLSGGQKQRLSIARAIAKEPLVFLFDDSFSALDYQTDRELRKELEPIVQDRINIVVAQRVMTVTDADEILVLDDGKIVDRGTHEELLKTSDIYREVAESQLGKEAING